MRASTVDKLEERLDALERSVYGKVGGIAGVADSTEPVIPKLTEMAKECGNSLEGRDRISPLLRRLKELESYLDPSFGESKGISAELKLEIVLNSRSKLLEAQKQLAAVRQKQSVLDKSSILMDVPNNEQRLVELSKVHIDQEERAGRLTESTLELVGQYNDIITTITETFVKYDELITKAGRLKS